MSIREAERVGGVPASDIGVIYERAIALEKTGRRVVHLEMGRPDFDTPAHIKAAAEDALRRGLVHYDSSLGLLELRRAIAAKLERDNGLNYSPEDEVMVTVGVSEGVYLALSAYLNPGDEVLVPQPTWDNYLRTPALVGGRAVLVSLVGPAGFGLDVAALERAITPRTRLLVLISPHNPTGLMVGREELAALAGLAERHDLLVLSDEIYEKITYDGRCHLSIASLPGMRERTIVLNGFSKAYSMTGWRLGYMAGPRQLLAPIVRVREYLTTCPPTFPQFGALAALSGSQDCVATMVAEFQRRRDLVVAGLNAIPGMRCRAPEGAFYVLADVSAYGRPAAGLAFYLLDEAGVALVPGTAFGPVGEGYLRLSFTAAHEELAGAIASVGEALSRLRD